MKLKQIILLIVLALLASFGSATLSTADTTSAYKCPATDSQGRALNMDETEFVCYYEDRYETTTHDSIPAVQCPDGSKYPDGSRQLCRKPQDGGDRLPQGDQKYCTDGQTIVNGNGNKCQAYGVMRANSEVAPTNNDGTPVDANKVSCEVGFNYQAPVNRCVKNGATCTGDGYGTGVNNPNDCRLPVSVPDDTTANGQQKSQDQLACEATGAAWMSNTKRCFDTQKSCEGRGQSWKGVSCSDNGSGLNNQTDQAKQQLGSAPNSPVDPVQGQSPSTGGQNCGKARTNIIKCQGEGAQAFGDLLKQLLSLLTMGVGILAVGGILFGAIMYASAQDNAGQVQKAISIITNTVIGLLLYIFMFAIANWLVPGGVIQ